MDWKFAAAFLAGGLFVYFFKLIQKHNSAIECGLLAVAIVLLSIIGWTLP